MFSPDQKQADQAENLRKTTLRLEASMPPLKEEGFRSHRKSTQNGLSVEHSIHSTG